MSDILTRDSNSMIELISTLDNILEMLESINQNNKPSLNNERYYTDQELSDNLKIARRTLAEYRSNGTIPYIKLGGKILYRETDILKLLKKSFINSFSSFGEIP